MRVALLGDPILRQRCRPVASIEDEELDALVTRLQCTLYDVREELGFGRGIAAPQVGSDLQVIFVDAGEPMTLVNPTIISRSDETFELWDDCLSLPSLLVRVRRHSRISIAFTDLEGQERTVHAEGDLSELLQHEMDHLDGRLILDRGHGENPVYLREEWKRQFASG